MAGAFLDWVSGPAWPQGTQRPYEILRGRARRDLSHLGINPRKRELLRGLAVHDTPRDPSQKTLRKLRKRMRRRPLITFIAFVQFVLCLTHLLLYMTWTFSPAGNDTPGALWIKLVLGLLSVSFVASSLLAFRYTNAFLRAFYRVAAVWMGLVSFLSLAAAFSWIIFGVARLAGLDMNFHRTVELLFGAAVVTGLYGVFNASWTRITRTTVRLANLPAAWHGRRAALISDVHLGHVRNGSFLRRMVAKILKEEPDAIFISGDLYYGTAIDAPRAAEPLSELAAPHGVYFVAGNS